MFLGELLSRPLPWGNPHSLQMPLCPSDLPQDIPSKCGADGAPSSPSLHLSICFCNTAIGEVHASSPLHYVAEQIRAAETMETGGEMTSLVHQPPNACQACPRGDQAGREAYVAHGGCPKGEDELQGEKLTRQTGYTARGNKNK